MEMILEGLMELAGARATIVLDAGGRVVAHRGHAVYDRSLCEQVGSTVMKAIESIQLQQDDWEMVTAQFADGRILLRRVGGPGGGSRHVLAIVADATLNASFATVALRVAANKVRAAVDGGGSQPGASSRPPAAASRAPGASAAQAPAASASALTPSDSRPVLANTGLSWAKSSNAGSSTAGISSVTVADPASAAFLTRCAQELARHVGPISKVYVQEGARRVSPHDAPFSLALARQLADDLAGQIEDPKDRAQFRKAVLEKK